MDSLTDNVSHRLMPVLSAAVMVMDSLISAVDRRQSGSKRHCGWTSPENSCSPLEHHFQLPGTKSHSFLLYDSLSGYPWLNVFLFHNLCCSQVEFILNEAQLRDEIRFLQQNLHLKNCMAALESSQVDIEMLGMKLSICTPEYHLWHYADKNLNSVVGLPRDKRESVDPGAYFKSTTLSLLLRWCAVVCAYYGLKVCVIRFVAFLSKPLLASWRSYGIHTLSDSDPCLR